ncbi:uncharacterized protein EV420DRAFT_1590382, partial [Desarmillaria tabescens]
VLLALLPTLYVVSTFVLVYKKGTIYDSHYLLSGLSTLHSNVIFILSTNSSCAAIAMLEMSTSAADILSTFLKKLSGVRRKTANSASSILHAASRRLACRPVGNTFAIPSSIHPTSMGIVPLATR